jgi:hypothetical protein
MPKVTPAALLRRSGDEILEEKNRFVPRRYIARKAIKNPKVIFVKVDLL